MLVRGRRRQPAATAPPLADRTLTVMVAARKAERWIGDAVRSVLEAGLPSGWSLEVLVCVDACIGTLRALRAEVADHRVRWWLTRSNGGQYRARNLLTGLARGSVLTSVDADDVVHPDRWIRLLPEFEDPSVGLVNAWFSEVNEAGAELRVKRGQPDGVWLYRREVVDRIGGYLPWRCAADTEFVRRARAAGFGTVVVETPLYGYRQHPGQITASSEAGKRSERRVRRRADIHRREFAWRAGGPVAKEPAPSAPVARYGRCWGSPVFASLAAVPERETTLRGVIESLRPQVDRVRVFWDGPGPAPAWLRSMRRVDVAEAREHGDRGDAGKFFWVGATDGYHLSCDDDIRYPDGYVDALISGIERYGRRAVCSFHGSVMLEPFDSFIRDRESLRFGRELAEDREVHVAGTGVAGFHTSAIDLQWSDFREANMADVWLAQACQRQGVPQVALAHPADWIEDLGHYDGSIYAESWGGSASHRDTAERQTEIVQSLMPFEALL